MWNFHGGLLSVMLTVTLPVMAAGGFVLNEDDSHFFMSREAEDMTLEGLHAFVDQYAGSQVSHLFLCPNAMKASFRSEVWDAIWDMTPNQRIKEDESAPVARRWMDNAKLLWERGLDPYAVWIARCREKGISPWLSMRMNDVHNVDDPDSYIHSKFWMDHPDYRRIPGGTGWTDRAFNYAIPEVREHHLKFIRELLERYDPDGLELDWMRFGYHFAPGQEQEGCAILTQFMREVKELAIKASKKQGHPILLGARVPTLPESAKGLGMDAMTWTREGLVDILVPTPFWATADFDIPIEQWRTQLSAALSGGKNKAFVPVLAAGIEILLRAYPGAAATTNDLASVRGFAASCLHRGADMIYTFNYMDPAPMAGGAEAYKALLEEGLVLEKIVDQPRRHPITYRDTVGPGMSNEVILPANPLESPAFKFHIGPAPRQGKVVFIAGLAENPDVAGATLSVTVNGIPCPQLQDPATPTPYPGAVRCVQFDCPLTALADAYNTVVVSQISEQPAQQIIWAELFIER